jgi:hypothetical protein
LAGKFILKRGMHTISCKALTTAQSRFIEEDITILRIKVPIDIDVTPEDTALPNDDKA